MVSKSHLKNTLSLFKIPNSEIFLRITSDPILEFPQKSGYIYIFANFPSIFKFWDRFCIEIVIQN